MKRQDDVIKHKRIRAGTLIRFILLIYICTLVKETELSEEAFYCP